MAVADKAILSPPLGTGSFVASNRDTLFLWGRSKDAEPETVYTYSVNTETWMREFTKGTHPPAGLDNGGCILAGQCIYLYGGAYASSFSGTLYELNTDDFTWSEKSNGGLLRKSGCRMITYKDQVLVVGGVYEPTEVGEVYDPDEVLLKQPGSRYEYACTNELHSYSLSAGSWSSPSLKGSRPPPYVLFSLTMIDEESAVMFGGMDPNKKLLNDVYILHMSTMFWEHLLYKDGDPRPEGRIFHITVCLGYGGQYKKVLVSGGFDPDKIFSDAWLLDPQSGRWEEVAVSNKKLIQRYCHSAASFTISPECMEVVLFGGQNEILGSWIADTAVLRFELQDFHSSGEKNWILTDSADHTQLGSQKRLDDKRRIMESFGSCHDGSVDARILQVEGSEKRAEDSDSRAGQLQRELSVVRQILQERTREVTSAREQLRECERCLTASTSHWIVKSEEIEMTGPELGRGGWAIVSVATFRGVRVAAKTIHRQIISHHNVQLFRREMNMAARLRHPNLVQFIGATMEGNMVILTELMPTSLRAQLQRDIYMPPMIVMSVSLDVARALNYLHQMQPDPIIHRDISSANVLLEPLRDGQWRAKLSDYGTVNLFDQLTTVNPGSPAYAAPEAKNPLLQSTKMDIYSFGALMLEMLTGQLPTPDDRPALLLKVHHDQLLNLIHKCLSGRAQDRPDAAMLIRKLTN